MSQYPLDHSRGYWPCARDAIRFDPFAKDHTLMAVWMWLSATANHSPGWARGSHGNVHLAAGDTVLGERQLAKSLHVARSTMQRKLRELERLGLIVRKTGPHGTVVSVCEYRNFHRPESTPESTPESSGGPSGKYKRVERENGRTGKRENKGRPGGSPSAPGTQTANAYTQVVRGFHELYLAAYSARPTWNGKAGAQVKQLLKAGHSAEEILRRARIMFGDPRRSFPEPPYDLGTLVAHFDRFAVSADQRRPTAPGETDEDGYTMRGPRPGEAP